MLLFSLQPVFGSKMEGVFFRMSSARVQLVLMCAIKTRMICSDQNSFLLAAQPSKDDRRSNYNNESRNDFTLVAFEINILWERHNENSSDKFLCKSFVYKILLICNFRHSKECCWYRITGRVHNLEIIQSQIGFRYCKLVLLPCWRSAYYIENRFEQKIIIL